MMVPPDICIEEFVAGRSRDEVMAYIREREEIVKELEAIMAQPDYEPDMDPCEDVRIWHAKECIKLAREELRRIESGAVSA